ncbi:DUF1697 domain-containing protein [Arthrobacter sp. Sa2CUA1]|uniref:DUF1697 domain-containing protein n=1 Tax=Arthrobacter gallicola TaxID=2762225 RepID=A0ABR8UPM6_9MICC|nr:DUF1697 domain-containing protein [Arthrobacter gallicola]
MTTYAILLRGVNVGGVNMLMDALRDTLSRLPVAGVRTVLASGNAVASSALSAAELKAVAEDALRKDFGYEAWVVVTTLDRLRELTAAVPYPPDDPETHAYVTFGSDAGMLTELFEAAAEAGAEQVRIGPEAIAWPSPKGGTLDSAMSKVSSKPRYKAHTTTRNVRTLQKILAAGEKM